MDTGQLTPNTHAFITDMYFYPISFFLLYVEGIERIIDYMRE